MKLRFSLVAKKLSLSENKSLIERFIKENLTSQGMIVDYAIHEGLRQKWVIILCRLESLLG